MNFCEWTKKKNFFFFVLCSFFFLLFLQCIFSYIFLGSFLFFFFFFRKSEEEQKINDRSNDDSNNLLNSIKSQNTGVDHFSTEQASMPQHQHQERFFETVGRVLFLFLRRQENVAIRDPRLL